jgi:hypothetical protein
MSDVGGAIACCLCCLCLVPFVFFMYITIATGVIANPEDCHPLTKIWLITDCIVFGLSILYLFGQGMKICTKSDQYKKQISKVKSLRASLRLEKGGGAVNNVACSEQELKAS